MVPTIVLADPLGPRRPCGLRGACAPFDPCDPCEACGRCDARVLDRFAAEAERLLGRRRAVLERERLDVAVGLEADCCAVDFVCPALELLAVRAVPREPLPRVAPDPPLCVAREPPLWLAREPLLRVVREALLWLAREPLLWLAREPLLWLAPEALLCEPLGLAPLRRERLDADRRLLELLDVVERSAMTLLGLFDFVGLGDPLTYSGLLGVIRSRRI
jgi:hypothetical protein